MLLVSVKLFAEIRTLLSKFKFSEIVEICIFSKASVMTGNFQLVLVGVMDRDP